ncbi:ATP-binding protein [Spirillospora sp. NPDC047279]|uniref:ATP-binding protein n=1 Tax=Spirillospora sp. NPDC047279 TaxID=3155478 RepID=UPI0033E8562C
MIYADLEIEVPVLFLNRATDQAPLIARTYVAEQLTTWGVTSHDDTLTVVSELVTNAYRHAGGGPITVRVSLKDARFVAIEVWDPSSREPVVLAPDLTAEGGRGMFMVACLAFEWGLRHEDGGKIVWAWIPVT